MKFPVQLSFRLFAFAPQIRIVDAEGKPIFFVRQKLLKFKEEVEVFEDESKANVLFTIKADRIIDWSAKYTFFAPNGMAVGAIKRSGMRSLWAAHYTIFGPDDSVLFELEQMNPFASFFDAILGEVPVIGLFTGYFLNPVYAVRQTGVTEPAMKLIKQRRFLESGFLITRDSESISEAHAAIVFMGAIMVTLLERARG